MIQALLFLISAYFHVCINGRTAAVLLGDHRIPYLNPVTGAAASCSAYVFAAHEYQHSSSHCISDAEVILSFTAPGAYAACQSRVLNLLLGQTINVSVVISNTSSQSSLWCATEIFQGGSQFVDKTFCNLAYPIWFKVTAFEPHSPSLQIIITDVHGMELIRSEEFTVSLLCPQVLRPDFTPLDKFYSVPRVDVLSASGWSDAFVSASVLVRKSQYSSSYLQIHAASYFEVFWTYKNNIAGGISAYVSCTSFLPRLYFTLVQGSWSDEISDGGSKKLGGSVFYGCGQIRDGRYLYFKYPMELHQGNHRGSPLHSLIFSAQ
jgi:hypothetical protein